MDVHPPFTTREFFDVLGAFNTAMWPYVTVLWIASASLVLWAARSAAFPGRAMSLLLAAHWAWSGIAYHALFFTRLSPAGWLFATAFVVEAMLLLWVGVGQDGFRCTWGRSARHVIAYGLVTVALAYPLVVIADGHVFPRAPLFAVPCPTTIFTAGVLLTLDRPRSTLSVVPVLWAAIGGSAAILFGVHADLVLFAAGALMVWDVVMRTGARGGHRRPVAC